QKSVGLNGVGTKAVNALSTSFTVTSIRDGQKKKASFEKGILVEDLPNEVTDEKNGTIISFTPDKTVFKNYNYVQDYVHEQIKYYAYLNTGLAVVFNKKKFVSKNGLLDLLLDKSDETQLRYPIIHLKSDDIEMAMTHGNQYGEDYYSFVNGQYTVQGGTHLAAFREAIVKTLRDFYKKNFDTHDIRQAIVGAIAIRVQEPVFESQTKTKLGSVTMSPDGETLRTFIGNFVKDHLDPYLHKNPAVAEALLKRIQQSERERKDMAGVRKIANERAKAANLHNKKLRDCRVHYSNEKHPRHLETTLFITEGDSASGSITKARDVETQAVFSLKGKPLNSFGLTKKIVYQNEEFNLLQHALNIEEDIGDLRYNRVVIATDADVDGMHIRLLLLTFFLQFFPDVVKKGHLYILETPLFRVRDKRKTIYCYSEEERREAIAQLKGKPEITRFKGLGEISPGEFSEFIGEGIRLEPVVIKKDIKIEQMLSYYMGTNTQERQNFIIENLKVEKDEPLLEEVAL
ncbi:MAG TPA: toprim domain-containing protein, partial [Chitinophagales bacterium]|nr:toprim domain-containing protein [Chitinophagales bacterium]